MAVVEVSGPDIDRILRGLNKITPEMDERAQLARRIFIDMLPTMDAFVQALTGRRDIRVVVHSGTPCTDGKNIYMRPPIELADRTPHGTAWECDNRDPITDLPVCPACVIREDVLITLYHEIAHIVAESFDSVSDQDRQDLVERAVRESSLAIAAHREEIFAEIDKARKAGDSDREAALVDYSREHFLYGRTRIEKLRERIEKMSPSCYMECAHIISPYLPMMVNALEDVRVNHFMYKKRPGTYRMFHGQALRIFGQGIQQPDGTYKKWIDMDRTSQMLVALFAKAARYEEYRDGWFIEEVMDALEDQQLCDMLKVIPRLPNAAAVYNIAFPILERLRELGFCKFQDEAENDPQPEGVKPEDEDGTAEGTGEGAGSGGSSAPEDEEQEDGTSGGEAGSDGEPGDSEEDDEDADSGAGDDGDEPADDEDSDEDAPGGSEGEGESEGEDDGEGGTGEDDIPNPPEPKKAGLGTDDPDGEDEGSDHGGCDGPMVLTEEEAKDNAAEAELAVQVFGGHGPMPDPTPTSEAEMVAVDRAVEQGKDFDAPSRKVFGVRIHRADRHVIGADGEDVTEQLAYNPYYASYGDHFGMNLGKPSESALGVSLLKTRAAFAENKTAAVSRNRKDGKIDKAVLGRRIVTGDDRLFMKRKYPGKRDYFVCIGIDLSGSTSSGAIAMEKEAAMAQAELLHRCGIPFAVYGHTANYMADSRGGYGMGALALDMFVVKEEHELWDSKAIARLAGLTPAAANLDGHSMEFYRKRCDESRATDKIILYYTDGLMPCENYDEELVILQREIKTCQRSGYTLLGVGIGTDSPTRHGLDTVQMDDMSDLPKVVSHLGKRMAVRRVA